MDTINKSGEDSLKKILITDNLSAQGLKKLREDQDWIIDLKTNLSPDELLKEIPNYEALIVRAKTKVTKELIQAASRLKIIGRAGTGVDNIDLEAATSKGVIVMNTPGGNSISVAELTIGLILALARSIPPANFSAKSGKWDKNEFTGFELKDKILGTLGFGKIGSEVAMRAKAFGMRILAYDPFVSDHRATDLDVDLVSFENLLANSDIITLHAPLLEQTREIINACSISNMKDGVKIINTARGELINEKDLVEALKVGKVASAALDVLAKEPPSAENSLLKHPNVIITPHIAASTVEAQEVIGIELAEQVKTFLKNGVVRNAVNFPSISTEENRKLGPFISLGEKLGSFVSQISSGRMYEIGIRYYGETSSINTRLVTNAIIVGILKPILVEEVNMINATRVLEQRGIDLAESRSSRQRSYSNLISVRLKSDSSEQWVEGTIFSKDNIRLTSVDGIDIEAPLTGTILFIRNNDTPGVIGQIGTLLGSHGINIANFALGRTEYDRHAVAIVNVDNPISKDLLNQIRNSTSVLFARIINL